VRCIITVICLLQAVEPAAQTSHLPYENIYMPGNAYSIHYMDAFSFLSNPACLPGIDGLKTGMVMEQKWMLKELESFAFACSVPLHNGGTGLYIQRSGDADYSEIQTELAYGIKLGKLEIGSRFDFLKEVITGYPGAGFAQAGISFRELVSEKLIVGWGFDLPVFGGSGKINPEKGTRSFKMGAGYEWGTDLFFSVQIVKTADLPVYMIADLAYRYGQSFFFSVEQNSGTGAQVFLAGWKKNRLSIQMYVGYETMLGFSPGLMILWNGKNSPE
jgi:hypothetical protein